MARAVIYTRVSSDKQEAENDSLEAQEQACRADCEQHGHEVVAVESDTFTGHNSLYDRPGMTRALDMIRSGEASLLVVLRVNRMARDMTDAGMLLDIVAKAGGKLRSTEQGQEFTNTPIDKLMMQVFAFQAEMDWHNIRLQTRGGIQSRVKKGRPLVSVPLFGYKFKDDERGEKYRAKAIVEVDDKAAPIVQDIFAKAALGWNTHRIATYLNEQGTVTPSQLHESRGQLGGRSLATVWTLRLVRTILTNESYTGRHAAYRTKGVKRDGERKRYKMVKRAPEEVVRIAIPALIDDATWDTVQSNTKARSVLIADAPLLNQGFAICGVCGTKMIAARQTNAAHSRIYRCRHRGQYGEEKCPGGSFVIKAEDADRDIWAKVEAILRDRPKFQRMVKRTSTELEEQRAEAARQAESVEEQLEELRTRKDTIYDLMVAEKNERIRADHNVRLIQLHDQIDLVEKRFQAATATLQRTQRDQHAFSKHLEQVWQRVEELKADAVRLEKWHQGTASIPGMDRAKSLQLLEAIPDVVDSFGHQWTRDEKRDAMRALGVVVRMHPRNYVDADGVAHERCEFTCNPDTDVPTGESS